MECLTELEMSEDGCIYELNGGYIVVVFACRGDSDTLYHTNDIREARDKIGVGEPEEEEPVQIQLHNGERLIDLMIENETLSYPRLKQLMEEQGYYLDEQKVIRKK
jgi:hypothetical protein